ncbi:baseplate J/gp47 family protein [Vibrio algicola]|uniref:Baseplate protein J-like barrel domain-containing protein n=1 Tax=Vibrio algicola TaxID=2662262 RepID=A0A5Q0TCA5_9VIBR|nr:baseplate J/gp47 family protein [Vibrio algicola]
MTTRPSIDFSQIVTDAGIPTTEEALAVVLAQAAEDAGSTLSNDSSMSPFWRWVRAVVTTPVLWLINVFLTQNILPNLFTATATGVFADLKAWETNTTRKDAAFTIGNIQFNKTNAADAVTINAGTIISTERIDDNIYQLAVMQTVVIPAGKAFGLVPCQAIEAGMAYNLAAGYYNILPVAVSGIDSVTNPVDWIIQLGADIESDDELCLRSQNAFTAVGNHHIDAVYRSIISSVAGIRADQIYFKNTGDVLPGSAIAYIMMESGETPQAVLDNLNDYIMNQGYHGHGDIMDCQAMPETQQDLTATVYPIANLSDAEKAVLLSDIELRIRAAFRESTDFDEMTRTWPQSLFSFSNMAQELHNTLPNLENIEFSLAHIQNALDIPRLNTLVVNSNE